MWPFVHHQFFLRLSVVCSIQKVGNSVGRIQGPAMATGGKNESLATSVHNIPKQTLEQARGTAPPPARAPPGVGATPHSFPPVQRRLLKGAVHRYKRGQARGRGHSSGAAGVSGERQTRA